ncbi:MAG: KH domain-containing protein [Bacillota bacterium]
MKEIVETIARSIVDHPEQVEVSEEVGQKSIRIKLSVAEEDMGQVIGKQGRIARAIRTVVKAAATKAGKKAIVDIKS